MKDVYKRQEQDITVYAELTDIDGGVTAESITLHLDRTPPEQPAVTVVENEENIYLEWDKIDVYKRQEQYLFCVLALLLIGGFLFQLLWEAKSRYIYYYMVLLLPLATLGISFVMEQQAVWRDKLKHK